MKPSRIHAVDHVHLEAPHGARDALDWFYVEVGGLDALPGRGPNPDQLRYRSERLELRIALRERPKIEAVACRLTLLVPCLARVGDQLEERGVSYERLTGITFTDRRLGMHDPGGNRVELKLGWPYATL